MAFYIYNPIIGDYGAREPESETKIGSKIDYWRKCVFTKSDNIQIFKHFSFLIR